MKTCLFNSFNAIRTNILLLLLTSFLSVAVAHAQNNSLIDPSQLSEAQIKQIVTNPQNENKVELVMFVLKSIEDLNITDDDKKIAFVNSLDVSNEIKDVVKSDIKLNITYSDHERVSYGIYRLMSKQCDKIS